MQENSSLKKTEEKQDVIKSDIWQNRFLYLITYYRERGDTYKKIAEKLGINECTIYRWKKESPEFARAIEVARITRDSRLVEDAQNALQKRVKGYEYKETQQTIEKIPLIVDGKTQKSKTGEDIIIAKHKQVVTTKQIAPDVSAIKLALYNKNSKEYRPEINQSEVQEDIEIIVEIEDD